MSRTTSLAIVLCLFFACSLHSENMRKKTYIYYTSTIVPEQWREVQIILILREYDQSYELLEQNIPSSFYYYNRREYGFWGQELDTIHLHPRWEVTVGIDTTYQLRDLSLEQNKTAFNGKKQLLMHKNKLTGIKKNNAIFDDPFMEDEDFSENDSFVLVGSL